MLDNTNIIKSRSILKYMFRLFGNQEFNHLDFEITYVGSRNKIKKAAKMLEYKRIWYRINWIHIEGKASPISITLQIDVISLRKN